MNYGKVEERNSSPNRSPSTARRAATSAILADILSRSDRAQTSHTVNARPGSSVLFANLVDRKCLVPAVPYLKPTNWFAAVRARTRRGAQQQEKIVYVTPLRRSGPRVSSWGRPLKPFRSV